MIIAKRIIIVIISVLILAVSYFFIRYDTYERKLYFANIKYRLHWKVSGFSSSNSNFGDYIIHFKNVSDHIGRLDMKEVSDICDNCKNALNDKCFDDYQNERIGVYFDSTNGRIFDVIFESREKIYKIISQYNISPEQIADYYPDVKRIEFWDKGGDDLPCDSPESYKSFTDLEYVYFDYQPSQKVVDYLNEKFPDCIIEYEKEK